MSEIVGFTIILKEGVPQLVLVDNELNIYATGVKGEEGIWREQRRGFPTARKTLGKSPDGDSLGRLADALPLQPPAPLPEKIVGVGKSYAAHAREFGAKVQGEPDYFLISPSALIGAGQAIKLPPSSVSSKVDYEGEIVLVLGDTLSRSSRAEAEKAVLGMTMGNDVTARDLQIELKKPWSTAKSLDTFKPLGPYVRLVEDSSVLDDLCLETRVSGKVMQKGCVGDMVMSLPELLASISKYVTLAPGDLVYTGTPPGVGYARNPPRLLRGGDVVRIGLTRPGGWGMVLENPVTS